MNLSHPHIHGNHHGFQRPGQRQRALDRDGFVGGAIRFALVVVAVGPEGEAVFDVVAGGDPADSRPPPFGGGKNSPVGIADQDGADRRNPGRSAGHWPSGHRTP